MSVAIVNETIEPLGDIRSIDIQIKRHLGQLLQRASTLLIEFNEIIHKVTVIQTNANGGEEMKFSWKTWLKSRSRLHGLSAKLKAIRTDLNLALVTLAA